VWAAEVPGTMLLAMDRSEHGGTSTIAPSTVGDGPIVVVEDDMAILPVECRLGGTSVEHL
jgi:hypothetical protein